MTIEIYRPRRRRPHLGARLFLVAIVLLLTLARCGTSIVQAISSPGSGAHTTTVHVPAGPGEKAWITALIRSLGARKITTAAVDSMAAWITHETPWPPVAAHNPMNTTLWEAGSTAYNTLPGGHHVWNYSSVRKGLIANRDTLLNGYPGIVHALRSGRGICGGGLAGEFSTWSGGGYASVC